MAQSYTVTQRVYSYDTFEASDIPEGMTPSEYAEQRYCEGMGDIDTHTLLVFKGDTLVYDGENLGEDVAPVENNYDGGLCDAGHPDCAGHEPFCWTHQQLVKECPSSGYAGNACRTEYDPEVDS